MAALGADVIGWGSLWLGKQCSEPDKPMTLESNAQLLLRKLDSNGHLLRVTMADGSYLRTDSAAAELRIDRRIPYLDLQFSPDTKELTLTTRGIAKRLGVAGVRGWQVTWNGARLPESNIAHEEALSVISLT